jgi:hypothetical protein
MALLRAAGLAFVLQDASSCTFNVSPRSSASPLHDAQRTVRGIIARLKAERAESGRIEQAEGRIVVCLAPGDFDLRAAGLLSFEGEADTPPAGVSVEWRGSPGLSSRLVGGSQITGWAPVILGGGSAYAAPVTAAAGFAPGQAVRQLWVAGARASRVVAEAGHAFGTLTPWSNGVPPSDPLYAAGFTASSVPSTFAAYFSSMTVELTWPIVIDNWIEPRCVVQSFAPDASGGNLTLCGPCAASLTTRANKGNLPPVPAFVEALPFFPLAPGIFFHDPAGASSSGDGVVYYALAPGQTVEDLEASAWVSPATGPILALNATSGHSFAGISFAYSSWGQPNSPRGFVDSQSAVYDCQPSDDNPDCEYGQAEPRGAIKVTSSAGISFIGCSFSHLGSPFALSIDSGSTYGTVSGSVFTDLSGGFLKLGSIVPDYANVTSGPASAPGQVGWDAFHTVEENVVSGLAVEYGGAAGLFGGYLYSAQIRSNNISDTGYSGLSIGWGWGASAPLHGVGNTTIAANYFANVMRRLKDGGGVYVNGGQAFPSQTIGNVVDGDNAVFAVFYLDNGASLWNFSHNVALDGPLAWAAFMQGCCNLPALDSHLEYLWWQSDLPMQNNCAAQNCTVDKATVVEVPVGMSWPQGAQDVISAAGARAAPGEVLARWRREREGVTVVLAGPLAAMA